MVIKSGREIDYTVIVKNIEEIINALEFDSMRSGGKAKMNAGMLNDLYTAHERYAKELKKSTPKKEG